MIELFLDIDEMDKTHEEFWDLLQEIKQSEKEEFMSIFKKIIEHTREHFALEEELMRKEEYYGLQEHLNEHAALLSEMEYFYEKAKVLRSFGYSYIYDYADEKFKRHVMNIDSQLAMFLKGQN